MEQFLLTLPGGKVVRIVIVDDRAPEGSVVTLICQSAPDVQLVPVALPEPSEPTTTPDGGNFPGMPLSFRMLDVAEEAPTQLEIDVTDLPAGAVPFTLDDFGHQVAAHLEGGSTAVRIGPANAQAWGSLLMGA